MRRDLPFSRIWWQMAVRSTTGTDRLGSAEKSVCYLLARLREITSGAMVHYRNTPRFQYLLQQALQLHAHERGYSDQGMIDEVGLQCAKTTLNRFRGARLLESIKLMKPGIADRYIDKVGDFFLNKGDAENLWQYLDKKGIIERTIEYKSLSKTNLYSVDEIANSMHCFYAIHRSEMKKISGEVMYGDFFCYKPSFRRKGFTVKSLVSLKAVNDDYFLVKEKQRTSGLFEVDRTEIIEQSEGFGFIKSNRLWLFLRDIETEQPRVFCFRKRKHAHITEYGSVPQDNEPRNEKVSSMTGYLIEGVTGNEDDAFKFNVMMIAESVDRRLWEEKFPDGEFDREQQIDTCPTDNRERARYAKELEKSVVLIPDGVIEYLEEGLKKEHVLIS